MSPSASQLHDIVNAFLAASKDLSATDHLALRAPECKQIYAPASLRPTAPKTNEVFAEHLNKGLRPLLDHFPITAKEIHVNEAGRQVTIWATGKPEFKTEVLGSGPKEEWDYVGEFIFILDVNEEGKIVRVLEFLGLGTERLSKLMLRARENLRQTGKA